MAEVEPQARVMHRRADHRAHVRQARTTTQPRFGVQTLAEWVELARQGFTATELNVIGLIAALRKLDARGQPDTLSHRRQNIATLGIANGMLQLCIVQRAVVHVVAALDCQRNAIAQWLEQLGRLWAERDHRLFGTHRALFGLNLPAAVELFQRQRIALDELPAALDKE